MDFFGMSAIKNFDEVVDSNSEEICSLVMDTSLEDHVQSFMMPAVLAELEHLYLYRNNK
jgi:hypothetical protein